MIRSSRLGFTLVELLFVIVIIGVLAAVAIPKFTNLTSNSKISAELATVSSVQTALDAVHSEWITNTCAFTWGNAQSSTLLNADGYPASLDTAAPFDRIFKTAVKDWEVYTPCAFTECYKGPASKNTSNVPVKAGKPDSNDYWAYDASKGTFTLVEP